MDIDENRVYADKLAKSKLAEKVNGNFGFREQTISIPVDPEANSIEVGDLVVVGNLRLDVKLCQEKNSSKFGMSWNDINADIGIVVGLFTLDKHPCVIVVSGESKYPTYRFMVRKLKNESPQDSI